MNTLAERVQEALADAKAIPADLARACEITPTSVSNWLSGETKSMKASTSMRAAEFLKVNQMWLAEGRGPKRPPDAAPPAPPAPPAPAPQPAEPSLSDDEQSLLSAYRLLSSVDQIELRRIADEKAQRTRDLLSDPRVQELLREIEQRKK